LKSTRPWKALRPGWAGASGKPARDGGVRMPSSGQDGDGACGALEAASASRGWAGTKPTLSSHRGGEMERSSGSFLTRVFLSPRDRRLRAAWRLAIQALLLFAITILVIVVFFWIGTWLGIRGGIPILVETQASTALGVTLSIFAARRWLDRRSFVSLGIQVDRGALNDFLFGFALLGGLAALEALVGWSVGWFGFAAPVRHDPSAPSVVGALPVSLFVLATVAWTEELLFRGYYLQNIREGWNLTAGVLLTSLLFPLVHPNLSGLGYLHLALAGLLLAFAYLRSGRLWLPIGLHLGWNFVGLSVFGLTGPFPYDVGLPPIVDLVSHAPLLAGVVSARRLMDLAVLGLAAVGLHVYAKSRS